MLHQSTNTLQELSVVLNKSSQMLLDPGAASGK